MFKILKERSREKSRTEVLAFRRADFGLQGPAWKDPMGYSPGEKRRAGEPDIQGSLPPSSRKHHTDK